MKTTKAKLRQIVLEEAIKLGEGQISSTIASTLLPGTGEYGQGAYASDIRDKEMEQRVYEKTVMPYTKTYYDIGKEYGISPNLIAGVMMDEDIRRYPDIGAWRQGADIFADIQGDWGRKMVAGGKRPAVGMGSIKLDSIILNLAQDNMAGPGTPYIDLNKELGLGLAPGEKPAEGSDIAIKVSEWLQKPENAIRATAARLAHDRDRFKNKADRALTDQELATGYGDHKKTGKNADYTASDRGNLAVEMGNDWLGPDVGVEDWWQGEDPHAQYESPMSTEYSKEDPYEVPGIQEGIILNMIKGAFKEML